jgi:DNA-binding MarR family transcriptional regulator
LGREKVDGEALTGALKAQWWRAMRWRAAVESSLAGTGLTFTQWLVLDALRDLIRESDDAVNQSEVAARVALSRANVSFVMRTLERKWLVSRGPDLTGRAWRIFLTDSGEQLLCTVAAQVGAAAFACADLSTAPPLLSPP